METTNSERARERQRLVAEVSSDLIYEWDVATDRLEWFGNVDTALGCEAREIPRTIEEWVARIHPEDAARMVDAVERHRTSTEQIFYTYRIRHQDGSWRWWEDRGVPVLDPEGLPIRWVGACKDISERRRAELDLHRSEEEFRTAFEASNDAILWADPDTGLITKCNRAAETLFETKRADILGRHQTSLHPPGTQERYAEMFRRHFDEGSAFGDEAEILTATGKTKPVQITASLPTMGGRIVVQGVFRDISERRQAEEEKRRLEERMQQAQKMHSLGVLAGGIAHDFNNMLCGMLGGAELALMDGGVTFQVREHLQHVKKTAQQATELCRQLLAYSGKGRFVVETVELAKVVQEMVHLLEVSISKKAVLRIEEAAGSPPVEADISQLRQIVLNLVINASEALEDRSGTIRISTGAMECDASYLADTWLDEGLPGGCYAFLEVSDTGQGMDLETRARIFDPFFSTKFAGRGLGLAATLGIVRGHRGAIKLYTEPGSGTTFKVLLPASPAAENPVATAGEAAAKSWRGTGTILLVDDEETVRAVGKRMLEALGYTVLLAGDGREGIEVFAERGDEIDLVVLDMTMPHLDGEETFRELRRLRPATKVILISGYCEQDAVSRFTGKGLAGFIQKPLTMAMLREKLERVLGPG